MSFRDHLTADLRLVLLRVLECAPSYECNSSILQMSVEDYGHNASRDQIHTELTWLSEQGLVTVDKPVATVLVATLTGRGLDVAKGRSSVPGVKRPGPGG